MSTTTTLVEALIGFQRALKPVAFDATGQIQHRQYRYATLAAVMNWIREPLANAGLALVQIIGEDELTTRLLHTSGEQIETHYPLDLRGLSAQAIGSAISYGRRYSVCSLLGVVADEDDDGAAASNGKVQRLASTFSMADPAPYDLKARLKASIVQEATPSKGITALRARMHELNADLRLAEDIDSLEGLLRGYDDDLIECCEKLPSWYAAAEKAIDERRRALSMPA